MSAPITPLTTPQTPDLPDPPTVHLRDRIQALEKDDPETPGQDGSPESDAEPTMPGSLPMWMHDTAALKLRLASPTPDAGRAAALQAQTLTEQHASPAQHEEAAPQAGVSASERRGTPMDRASLGARTARGPATPPGMSETRLMHPQLAKIVEAVGTAVDALLTRPHMGDAVSPSPHASLLAGHGGSVSQRMINTGAGARMDRSASATPPMEPVAKAEEGREAASPREHQETGAGSENLQMAAEAPHRPSEDQPATDQPATEQPGPAAARLESRVVANTASEGKMATNAGAPDTPSASGVAAASAAAQRQMATQPAPAVSLSSVTVPFQSWEGQHSVTATWSPTGQPGTSNAGHIVLLQGTSGAVTAALNEALHSTGTGEEGVPGTWRLANIEDSRDAPHRRAPQQPQHPNEEEK